MCAVASILLKLLRIILVVTGACYCKVPLEFVGITSTTFQYDNPDILRTSNLAKLQVVVRKMTPLQQPQWRRYPIMD
jgi:hypothetical protein